MLACLCILKASHFPTNCYYFTLISLPLKDCARLFQHCNPYTKIASYFVPF